MHQNETSTSHLLYPTYTVSTYTNPFIKLYMCYIMLHFISLSFASLHVQLHTVCPYTSLRVIVSLYFVSLYSLILLNKSEMWLTAIQRSGTTIKYIKSQRCLTNLDPGKTNRKIDLILGVCVTSIFKYYPVCWLAVTAPLCCYCHYCKI